MAIYKSAFKELAAALAEEVACIGRHPHYRADFAVQQAHSNVTSQAKHDQFRPVADEIFPEVDQVSVEDWLEAQLLDCQNVARRDGFAKLSGILDEALDALMVERKRPSGSPADWQT
jgi:hypothetical protein